MLLPILDTERIECTHSKCLQSFQISGRAVCGMSSEYPRVEDTGKQRLGETVKKPGNGQPSCIYFFTCGRPHPEKRREGWESLPDHAGVQGRLWEAERGSHESLQSPPMMMELALVPQAHLFIQGRLLHIR